MKIKLDLRIWTIILIFITIASLSIRYFFMTDKFFIDSTEILRIAEKGAFEERGSYGAAACFFSWLNLISIDNLFAWSVYICFIYFYINLWVIKDIKSLSIGSFFFVLLSLFLWYIFSAGMTKEIVQGLFYLIIYLVCIKGTWIKSNYIKIVLGSVVLLFSSLVFREYYILTAFFTVVVYLIFNTLRCELVTKKTSITHMIFLCLLAVGLFLCVASVLFPDEYEKIVTLRNTRYMYLAGHTDTFIADLIENPSNSVVVYIGNYILNFMRLLFPVELIVLGKLYYLPFLLYQFMFTWLYYNGLKEVKALNNEMFLSLIFLTSFLIVSAMMEPDFGSWARHQSVCWMLSFEALCREDDVACFIN